MKFFIYFFLSAFILVGSCSNTKHSVKIENLKTNIKITDSITVIKYANTITTDDLKSNVYKIASKNFNGRETGTFGQKKAAEFIKNFYEENSIESPLEDNNYYQVIDKSYFNDLINIDSENVIAYIKGSEKPEEVIVLSAHFDHLGNKDGEVFLGADDNGSGTAAVMLMAKAFKKAAIDGNGPKRTIVFLHVTAEEIGLYGSRYYTENPAFPLENTICNLNIDMIGRTDALHKNNENYIYLIGSDRLSTELHYLSEKVNSSYFNLELDYTYNDENDRNRYYYRSDHYNFAKNNIPVIFYFNGVHPDYHLPTDTPDKINFSLLEKRAKLIFATTWQIANQEPRIIADKADL